MKRRKTRQGLRQRDVPRANALTHDDRLLVKSAAGAAGVMVGLMGMVALDISASEALRGLFIFIAWLSLIFAAIRLLAFFAPPRHDPAPLPDEALPSYSVLLPVFREAHMIDGLMAAMDALDYPKDRLQVQIICEMVDHDTIDAVRAALRPPFELVIVPDPVPGGEPRTKPRALNYAMKTARGDIVTIYDAEDRPHPQQLRQAASAFAAHPDWAALQAPLTYFNTGDSVLAAQFGLEYDGLFRGLLPFFDRLGLPFPLGGTSNHMRREPLDAVQGWDPYNVTEDADLSFRLASRRDGPNRIGWISAPTQEEAVARLRPWVRQRSRWLKGYIQTWRVHMRAPLSGGWRRVVMLQLTLGLSLLAVLAYAPIIAAILVGLIWAKISGQSIDIPPIYIGLFAFTLACGMAMSAIGAWRAGHKDLIWHVPLMPIYWLLLFPPLLVAIYETRTRPFFWHKTAHGVTARRFDPADIEADTPHGPDDRSDADPVGAYPLRWARRLWAARAFSRSH